MTKEENLTEQLRIASHIVWAYENEEESSEYSSTLEREAYELAKMVIEFHDK